MKELTERLAKVQYELKAPKGQFNKFGKYNYRSCEDILEGLKLVLNGLVVTISDDVVMVGDRIYIKATASVTDGIDTISNSAFARESLTKKGMDESQITGTASSYARKYALNGLFLIDDTKDADSMDNSQNETYKQYSDKFNSMYAENREPLVLWGYMEKFNDYDEIKQYIYSNFPKGQKTKIGSILKDARDMFFQYKEIFESSDESAIAEAKAELSDIELKIVEAGIKARNNG